jgi:hypothetical protein
METMPDYTPISASTALDPWQIEAIEKLLETGINQVEAGERVYISSQLYGSSRYHLIDKKADGIQIEQVNVDEKWGSRVQFKGDELPKLLRTLLEWYLEDYLEPSSDHPF